MTDYTNAASIRQLVSDSGFSTDTSYDSLLGVLITAASRAIDRFVGGWDDYFVQSGSETRYFDGTGENTIYIDPMVELTSVAVSESGYVGATDYTAWTLNTDYMVWPYNYAAMNKPIRELRIIWHGNKNKFYNYPKSVKVTGRFGRSASVPDDVSLACAMQVNRWFMRAKSGFQDASAAASVGQVLYTKELDPEIRFILQHYKDENMVLP